MKYKLVEVLEQDADCTKDGKFYNLLACNEIISANPDAKKGWLDFKTDKEAIAFFGITFIGKEVV